MKDFIKTVAASMMGLFLGTAIIIFFLMIGLAGLYFKENKDLLFTENGVGPILEIELDSEIVERVEKSPLNFSEDIPFFNKFHRVGLYNLQQTIDKASRDEQIEIIYLKMGRVEGGWASLSALYDSLEKFKRTGKIIIAYSESYSEKAYYLASLANKIYLYPAGSFEFNGLTIVQSYFKGLWEKLHIEPQIFRVGKFKSAVEPFLFDKMSEEGRAQTNVLLTDLWQSFVDKVRINRHIPMITMVEWLNEGTIQNAEDALKNKLVDGLRAEWEVLDKLRERVRGQKSKVDLRPETEESVEDLQEREKAAPIISWNTYSRYLEKAENKDKDLENEKNQIALVYVTGDIMDGKSQDGTIGSETLVNTMRDLNKDPDVKAIVLRINSPGGSALAADVLWNEIEKVKKSKPIIASLGDVAASGAYYVASNCHQIMARPNTITGSIGVFGIYMNFKNFFKNHLGVTFDGESTGPYADLGFFHRPLREYEKKKIQDEVNRTYQRFLQRVAKGRKISEIAKVAAVAEGRLWSGKKALELGLIDSWGGIEESLIEASKMASIEKNYYVETYPKKKNAILDLFYSLQDTQVQISLPKFFPFQELELLKNTREAFPRMKNGLFMMVPFALNIE